MLIVMNDSVVGDHSKLGIGRSLTGEQKRSHEDVVPLQSVVLANDALIDVGNEEESGQNGKSDTGTDRHTSNPVSRLLGKTELGRALVDDGQSTDSTGDEEEER